VWHAPTELSLTNLRGLSWVNLTLDLRFVESGFARVSRGEDVEEAAELPAVCGAQAVGEAAGRSFRGNPGQSVSLALSLLAMGGKTTGEN